MCPGEALWSYYLRTSLAIGACAYFLVVAVRANWRNRKLGKAHMRVLMFVVIFASTLSESWFPDGVSPFNLAFWTHVRPPFWSMVLRLPGSLPSFLVLPAFLLWHYRRRIFKKMGTKTEDSG